MDPSDTLVATLAAEAYGVLALEELHGQRVLPVTWPRATAGTQQTLTRIGGAGAPTARR